ncbi:hypothetical protein QBC41DRAFT_305720 [Cercophora samala]|uniref:Uncharacterized protein n=1 Tax=Cercophora samala TaxID=330535 RepID=A0AA39Z7X2_9PEZI|nr:hypothetical protein QBC41DRAFT_305720 [Cercophora samala]
MLAPIFISILVATTAGLIIPNDSHNHTFAIEASKPGMACAKGRETMCCDELDYSGYEVQCVGPGKVDYFEKCLDYDPLPMCCCGMPGKERKDLPTIPTLISCTECTIISMRRQLRKKPHE